MARVTSILLFVSFLLSTAFSLKKFFVSSNVKCIDVSRTKLRAIWDLNLQRLGKGSRLENSFREVTKSWKYQVLTDWSSSTLPEIFKMMTLKYLCSQHPVKKLLQRERKKLFWKDLALTKGISFTPVWKMCDDTRNPLPRYTIRYVEGSNW